ncbi:alanine:cation symporter family protein, partial [Bacillus sp. D-CC]
IFLFAFSSLLGNYYYGETNIAFIKESKTWLMIYRVAVVGMVFFGSIAALQTVWSLADLFMGLMVFTNLIAKKVLAHGPICELNACCVNSIPFKFVP